MASVELRNLQTGTWRAIIYDGYNSDGTQKRIRRTIKVNPNSTEASQRKQAEKQAARIQTDYDDKRITDAKKVSFKSVYDDYVQDRLIRRGLAEQTVDSYKKLFRLKLIPEFGKMAIRDIETADVNRFLRKLEKPNKNGKRLSGTYCLKYFQQFLVYLFSNKQVHSCLVLFG